MYKLSKVPSNASLSESSQANPIRWCLVHKKKDALKAVTPWFKCKDYFNDIVAAKHGAFFTQYGFDNSKVVDPNEAGAYVVVNYIQCKEKFKDNLASWGNPEHPVVVEYTDDQQCLLYIPAYYFENTYRISLLTYLIRLSNQEEEGYKMFPSVTAALQSQLSMTSSGMVPHGRAFATKHGWDAREGGKYWWRYIQQNNISITDSETHKSTIHNCGVNAWALCNTQGTENEM